MIVGGIPQRRLLGSCGSGSERPSSSSISHNGEQVVWPMNKEIFGVLLFLVGLGAVSFGVIQMQQGWSEDPKVEQPAFVKDH